jgi:glycosyltransferase involved in cell wall biosynthesis
MECDMRPRKVFANKSAAFLVSEDWFANSHFRGLIADYCRQFETVHVVTRLKAHAGELESLGARPIHFDFQRVATNPLVQMRVIGRLGHLLAELQPDHVHGIAAQVNVVAASALMLRRLRPTFFMHITGIGFIGDVDDPVARLLRPVAMMPLRIASRWPTSAVFVENPEDAQFLKDRGVGTEHPITVLGGAGVDAEFMTACPDPANEAPIAAFVGRLILSKGLHELIEAGRILRERGVKGSIRLFGRADGVKGDYFDPAQLQSTDGLSAQSGIENCGFESDVRRIWRQSDIFVLPALKREGMPRAMLEAAACGRPLIVSDVPGCRHFVRDGVEGIVVPIGDAGALADAMERLMTDPDLRTRMGRAARARVIEGFTDRAVRDTVTSMLARVRGRA